MGMKNGLYEQSHRTPILPITQVTVLFPIHTNAASVRCRHRLDSPDIMVWRVALAFVEPSVERELVGVLALRVGDISVGDPAPWDKLPVRLGGLLISGHLET